MPAVAYDRDGEFPHGRTLPNGTQQTECVIQDGGTAKYKTRLAVQHNGLGPLCGDGDDKKPPMTACPTDGPRTPATTARSDVVWLNAALPAATAYTARLVPVVLPNVHVAQRSNERP
jgi:hypothetical protein